MTSATPYYGGGHMMRTGADLTYWALRDCSVYYPPTTVFTPPSPAVDTLYMGYGRIAACISKSGVEIPERYIDLMSHLAQFNAFIEPAEGVRTRGALLIKQGAVCISIGDGRRVVYEEDYRLCMKYLRTGQDPRTYFEFAAKVPGMEYL